LELELAIGGKNDEGAIIFVTGSVSPLPNKNAIGWKRMRECYHKESLVKVCSEY